MTAVTRSTFSVTRHRADLPLRPRTPYAGHAVFRTDGGHEVLIAGTVRSRVVEAARAADPEETGGLLLGRVFRDDRGTYTLVDAMVRGPASAQQAARFTMSADQTAGLKDHAARQHPTSDPVGWWHSHLGASGYSQTDLANQQVWTDPRHVGLLVFARPDQTWARVFVGPESVPAAPVADGAGLRRAVAPAPSGESRPERMAGPSRRSRLPLLGALGVLAGTAGAVGAAVVLGGVSATPVVDDVPLGIAWSCQPHGVGGHLCTAASADAADLVWVLDGAAVGFGPGVVLPPAGETAGVLELRLAGPGARTVGRMLLAAPPATPEPADEPVATAVPDPAEGSAGSSAPVPPSGTPATEGG